MEALFLFVRIWTVNIFWKGGVWYCRTRWICCWIRPTKLVGAKNNFLCVFLHSICCPISRFSFRHHTIPPSQVLVCLFYHLMISSDHDFWWKLKPHIITINDQYQIIILNLRPIAQKVEDAFYLASVTSLVPIVTIECHPVVDQCRRRVAEYKGRKQCFTEIRIRFGGGYKEVERWVRLLQAEFGIIDRRRRK